MAKNTSTKAKGASVPAKAKTAVPATKKSTAVALSSSNLESLAGMGAEQVTQKDLLIPRLTILQALSPQLKKKEAAFIDGAEAGMFCDVGTGEVFEDEIIFIPCFYAMVYLEWAPRNTGKGLVMNHGTNPAILDKTERDEKGKNVLSNGNYVVETATWFGLNMTAGGRKCFLPLSSTQLKASRGLMTKLKAQRLPRADGGEFEPPLFYRSIKCSIAEQSNNEGDWFGWRFEFGDTILEIDPSGELLQDAKAFCEMAKAGLVQADVASMSDEPSGDEDRTM